MGVILLDGFAKWAWDGRRDLFPSLIHFHIQPRLARKGKSPRSGTVIKIGRRNNIKSNQIEINENLTQSTLKDP